MYSNSSNYQSWKSVKALHDRLLRAARQLGWQKLLDSEMSPTQVLPAPPIASDERFRQSRRWRSSSRKASRCITAW